MTHFEKCCAFPVVLEAVHLYSCILASAPSIAGVRRPESQRAGEMSSQLVAAASNYNLPSQFLQYFPNLSSDFLPFCLLLSFGLEITTRVTTDKREIGSTPGKVLFLALFFSTFYSAFTTNSAF